MKSVKIIGEKFQTSQEIDSLFSIWKNNFNIYRRMNEKDRRWKNGYLIFFFNIISFIYLFIYLYSILSLFF